MVNHFTDLIYVHLSITISQDETLSEKVSFERWSVKFGVKIKIYHADNGIFAEQPFISEIEDAN